MSDVIASVEAVEEVRPVELSADLLDDQLVGQLVDRARASGLQLTGEGGLLQQLTKRVLESALEGEITDHLGYEKHDRAGAGSGNSRNGVRSKTVLTDVGPVEIEVPRDREGSFEPQIVKKRQRRLTGVDEMVLSLSARGLTHGDISAHLAEVYGAISYYLTHRDEIDRYLQEREEEAAAVRAKIEAGQPARPGFREELLRRRAAGGSDHASAAE